MAIEHLSVDELPIATEHIVNNVRVACNSKSYNFGYSIWFGCTSLVIIILSGFQLLRKQS